MTVSRANPSFALVLQRDQIRSSGLSVTEWFRRAPHDRYLGPAANADRRERFAFMMVDWQAIRSHTNWPLVIGALGLIGPSAAIFAGTGLTGALISSALALCIWSAVLGWAWYEDGILALVKLLPSLIVLLLWPIIGLSIFMTCGYDACS